MSQSLADLFASGTGNQRHIRQSPAETTSIQRDIPLAYPAGESISDVIPPDEGKSVKK